MQYDKQNPRHLSDYAFRALGNPNLVYIKPVIEDGKTAFSVHSADGQNIALMESREHALAAAWEHDLQPVSVH